MRGGTKVGVAYGNIIEFQSTLPMRGGTNIIREREITMYISIHPPHAGRDITGGDLVLDGQDFNPPSPCGEGPSEII